MKKLFILLTCIAVLASCGKDNKWAERTVDINVRESVTKADGDSALTPAQVVRKAYNLIMRGGARGWSEAQVDTVNNKLKMWSTDIIDANGNLVDGENGFLNEQDARIVDSSNVVIAYIPNAVLTKAKKDIIEAYEKGDHAKVYQLFEDAYTAIPITQSAYDELVRQGAN